MRQEEQLISFNSAVPRFKANTTHQIRLLPNQEGGKQSNVDFMMKRDLAEIGPGTYMSGIEYDEQQR